jgi:hypothetical protein
VKRSIFNVILEHQDSWDSHVEIGERFIPFENILRKNVIQDHSSVKCILIERQTAIVPIVKDQIRISTSDNERYICLGVDGDWVWVKAPIPNTDLWDYQMIPTDLFECWPVVE